MELRDEGCPKLIGMVHASALPGTPRSEATIDQIVAAAVADARVLAEEGFDALILENMHDVPYLRREVGPEIVAAMTRVGSAILESVGTTMPLGVQILAGANRAALAVAQTIGASFIRAEGFVFASVADEGILDEADAGPLLRYRRAIGAEHVRVFADIKKKHSSHALTADVDIVETARAAEFCGVDGVIVSGSSTGAPTNLAEVRRVAAACGVPVLVGSGGTTDTVREILSAADGLIVGSATKRDGSWRQPVDRERARAIVSAAR